MPIYQWKGLEGNKMNSGEIEAINTADATEKLKQKKIVVTNLVIISGKEKEDASGTNKSKSTKPAAQKIIVPRKKKYKVKKIKTKELMIFTKKFSTMVQAGMPILKTLKMLEQQQEKPNFQWVVKSIKDDVEAGSTLSQAFSEFPTIFDTVYINLIKAGESSGKLTLFLQKLVIQIEKAEKIRSKLKGALSYPIILLSVAFIVITIMLVKVVPVFQTMFASMGHTLPGPTQLIVNISEFCRNPYKGGVLLANIIGGIVTLKYLIKTNLNFKRKFDKFMLKVPIIGEIIQKSSLAKIAMVQGNLSVAGVSILESLDIVAKTVTNTQYIDAFEVVKKGIESGNSLSSLYSTCKIFPTTFHQMLAVGEETGNLDEMFESTARYYEEEFDMAVDHLTEALEPIMIVSMGITVGFIIIAMYMPIFKIGEMVSK